LHQGYFEDADLRGARSPLGGVQRDITLVWGARDASGLYLRPAVDRWQKQWPGFRFIPALSDVPADAAGDAFLGRVDEAVNARCGDLAGHVRSVSFLGPTVRLAVDLGETTVTVDCASAGRRWAIGAPIALAIDRAAAVVLAA
jgi:hypothetical protein